MHTHTQSLKCGCNTNKNVSNADRAETTQDKKNRTANDQLSRSVINHFKTDDLNGIDVIHSSAQPVSHFLNI